MKYLRLPKLTFPQMIGFVSVTICVAALLFVYCWPDSDKRAFRRIKAGMTVTEVQNVLGRPPGYSAPGRGGYFGEVEECWGEKGPLMLWSNENSWITVFMDRKTGDVIGASFGHNIPEHGFVARIRDWLK